MKKNTLTQRIYDRANNLQRSSRKSVKEYARLFLLLSEKIDITQTNLRTEGITIGSFSNLVDVIYDLGYLDGEEHTRNIQAKKKKLILEAETIDKHNRLGRMMSNMEKN